MKNVSHKKSWRTGAVKIHVYPPPVPLIKINNNAKSVKDCAKIKLFRYSTSETLCL